MLREMRGGVLAAVVAANVGCSAGTGEAPAGQCAYPSGPRGYAAGDIAPPELAWRGSEENGAQGIVSIRDYYDCDGSRGIRALLVDQSTAWCSVCQTMADKLGENLHGSFRERGIHVLTLLTETPDRKPATVDTALAWKHRFGLDGSAVVADPTRSFRETLPQELAPYPYEILIDPRTMQIVSVNAGYDGRSDFPSLVELAEKNTL